MSKKLKVLVIDDDEIHIFIVQKLIEKTKKEVELIAKTNGLAAINYLQQVIAEGTGLPDIVLVDINMPVLDGWEFLIRYQALPINDRPAIYILSSSVHYADVERAALFTEVRGFIYKPISVDYLCELLDEVVS